MLHVWGLGLLLALGMMDEAIPYIDGHQSVRERPEHGVGFGLRAQRLLNKKMLSVWVVLEIRVRGP